MKACVLLKKENKEPIKRVYPVEFEVFEYMMSEGDLCRHQGGKKWL